MTKDGKLTQHSKTGLRFKIRQPVTETAG